MRKYFFIFSLSTILFSCDNKQENQIDVSAIKINFSIDRFDIDFYTTKVDSLFKTKEKYPLFFPKNTPDSVWIKKIKNTDEQELFIETQKRYTAIDFLKNDLTQLFKHIKYYNPDFKAPKVVTLLSNIDYQNRVIYTKGYLLISLDVYLGKNHKFYADYPSYIKQNFEKNHIVIDVAKAIIPKQNNANDRTFVSKMITEGKQLYLLESYLPNVNDNQKIGYSVEKNNWAIENEAQVWKYFIENKYLFSTDTKLNKRFLELAPFSKFYRSEDALSPGRIGAWIGWQIVKSYMLHNDVSLQQLLKTPSEEVYKNSKYKPKK
jgi:gliding motility-associated lipoprotein GldB